MNPRFTKEIDKLLLYTEKHPADFKAKLELIRLIKLYGIELDNQQNRELL